MIKLKFILLLDYILGIIINYNFQGKKTSSKLVKFSKSKFVNDVYNDNNYHYDRICLLHANKAQFLRDLEHQLNIFLESSSSFAT